LFGGMVTRRQIGDEGRNLPCHVVYSDDTRTVVLTTTVSRLIGIGRKEPPA